MPPKTKPKAASKQVIKQKDEGASLEQELEQEQRARAALLFKVEVCLVAPGCGLSCQTKDLRGCPAGRLKEPDSRNSDGGIGSKLYPQLLSSSKQMRLMSLHISTES